MKTMGKVSIVSAIAAVSLLLIAYNKIVPHRRIQTNNLVKGSGGGGKKERLNELSRKMDILNKKIDDVSFTVKDIPRIMEKMDEVHKIGEKVDRLSDAVNSGHGHDEAAKTSDTIVQSVPGGQKYGGDTLEGFLGGMGTSHQVEEKAKPVSSGDDSVRMDFYNDRVSNKYIQELIKGNVKNSSIKRGESAFSMVIPVDKLGEALELTKAKKAMSERLAKELSAGKKDVLRSEAFDAANVIGLSQNPKPDIKIVSPRDVKKVVEDAASHQSLVPPEGKNTADSANASVHDSIGNSVDSADNNATTISGLINISSPLDRGNAENDGGNILGKVSSMQESSISLDQEKKHDILKDRSIMDEYLKSKELSERLRAPAQTGSVIPDIQTGGMMGPGYNIYNKPIEVGGGENSALNIGDRKIKDGAGGNDEGGMSELAKTLQKKLSEGLA